MAVDVSVIVPTYNRADLISETLASILQQSYQPAEVIVVDDGSADDTEAVVARYGSMVRYLRIRNSGECAARNAGAAIASTPWLAFCDSDDLWHPDKLRLQASLFQSAPDVDYCFTNFSTVVDGVWSPATKFDSSPSGYWRVGRREIDKNLFVIETQMFEHLLLHQPIFPSTLMMKKSFFETVGRWNEPLGRTRSVDLEFHLRCITRPPIGVVAKSVVGIRKHNANFSADPLINALGEIQILHYVLDHHPTARTFEQAIRDEIIRRTAQAAEYAFDAGDLAKTRELMKSVPFHRQSTRQRVKGLIARLPGELGPMVREASLGMAGMRRRYSSSAVDAWTP